ncbi:MAG: VOC family protein [Chloroflexi bacterium SZAS-1]|jgi:uncharacterized glyoxalase superfamily protein PhnB|nr:VOC family protein [Chloroflexi bacterium SZAS-1]HNP88486.1 VOC family protein [Kouleothrix sp.]
MAVHPDMVGIIVSNMAASLTFYRMLGLNIAPGQEHEPHVEVMTPNGYRIAWDSEDLMRDMDPNWQRPVGQRVGLAFKCDSPAEVDALYAQIVAAGYRGHKAPWDAFWGQRYAQVADPDGTVLDLFAALA